MRLIDSIAYFSGYLASLIDFPSNWSHITMWLSMDADIFSSVSIIFDYHVSLNLADILHNFCVFVLQLIASIAYFSRYLASLINSMHVGALILWSSLWNLYLFRHCALVYIDMFPRILSSWFVSIQICMHIFYLQNTMDSIGKWYNVHVPLS